MKGVEEEMAMAMAGERETCDHSTVSPISAVPD